MVNKNKYLKSFIRWGGLLGVALLATGCAVNPGAPVDRQGLGNAIAIDDVARVRALVQAKAIAIDEVVPGAGYAATPMITVAARNASINVLRYLISAKADLNARTPDRDTPLMLASLFGREELQHNSGAFDRYDLAVRLLVEAGAAVDPSELNAYAPLSYAAYAGRDRAIRYLLEKGAKVNASAQGRLSYVNTPLMMAAMQGNRNAAVQLLRAGADATVRVQNGMTAMEFAQKNKHTQMERLLRCAESLNPGESFQQRCE